MVRSAKFMGDDSDYSFRDYQGLREREDKQIETVLESVSRKKKTVKAKKPDIVAEPPPPAFRMDLGKPLT